MGFEVIDINLGCPIKKVLRNQAGSCLLQQAEKIYAIFEALTRHFPHLVFTGKIRLGFNKSRQNYLENARAVEEGGGQMLTVHGRTRCQMYQGEVDLEAIHKIKESLSIPVIGNGNIFTPEDAGRMLELTGCDGVMAARGMLGNPWFFGQIAKYLETGSWRRPTIEEKLKILEENFELETRFDPRNGYREFKRIGVKYLNT